MEWGLSFCLQISRQQEKGGLSIPLPNLPTTYVDLCIEGVLLPDHISHTFLHSPTSPHHLTFDPVALFVSTLNLHKEMSFYPSEGSCQLPSQLRRLASAVPSRHYVGRTGYHIYGWSARQCRTHLGYTRKVKHQTDII